MGRSAPSDKSEPRRTGYGLDPVRGLSPDVGSNSQCGIWGPTSIERNVSISEEIWVQGTLLFSENQTLVENVSLSLYLVEPESSDNVPGSLSNSEHIVASVSTDSNGSFNLTGLPKK